MKRFPFILLLIFSFSSIHAAETVYKLNLKTEAALGIATIALWSPSWIGHSATGQQPAKLGINSLDRSYMYAYHATLDDYSTACAYFTLVMPGVTVLSRMKHFDVLTTYAMMYLEAFSLTFATKDLLKSRVHRYRPHTYFDSGLNSGHDITDSFPSGHTAFAFLGASFLATTLMQDLPDAKWRIPAMAAGYTLATGVGIMRVKSGNHFITDAITGAAIGSFFGWVVPRLHLKSQTDFVIQPKQSGIMMCMRF